MKRLLIATTALLVIGVSGVPFIGSISSPAFVSIAQAAEAEQTAIFDVPGMTCALCPVTVKKAMGAVEGVKSVTVDFDARTATVVFDPSITSIDVIAAASANAGYPAAAKG
jgi:mercuric ion binding protein